MLFCLLFSSFAYGQFKFEKEYRVKESLVPIKSSNFIQKIKSKKRLKWYKEESYGGQSFEAKFKLDKIKYSIEFDTLGNLEDIEELIELSDLNDQLKTVINEKLMATFNKNKIEKIQKQLIGEEEALIHHFKEENNELISGYELTVKGWKDKEVNLYELFFNEKGELINEQKVIIKSSVHLEY